MQPVTLDLISHITLQHLRQKSNHGCQRAHFLGLELGSNSARLAMQN